jgi:hypothetical protein
MWGSFSDVGSGLIEEERFAPVLEMTKAEITWSTQETPDHAGLMAVVHDGCAFRQVGQTDRAAPVLLVEELVELLSGQRISRLKFLPTRTQGATWLAGATASVFPSSVPVEILQRASFMADEAGLHRGMSKLEGSLTSNRDMVWRAAPALACSVASSVSWTLTADSAGAGALGISRMDGGWGVFPHITHLLNTDLRG